MPEITLEVLKEQVDRAVNSPMGPTPDSAVVMHTMFSPPEGFEMPTTDNGQPVVIAEHSIDGNVYEYTLGEVKAMLAFVEDQDEPVVTAPTVEALPESVELHDVGVEDLTSKEDR